MNRKKYSRIKKSLLIHILNTTSTIPAEQVKKINKRIYQAEFRGAADSRKGESYKGMYEWLDKAYHTRVIAGEA